MLSNINLEKFIDSKEKKETKKKTTDKTKADFEKELDKVEAKKQAAAEKQQGELSGKSDAYQKGKERGVYAYFTEIDSHSLFFYIVVLIVVYVLLSFLNINFKNVISILVGIALVYYLNEKRKSTETTEMQEIELKLYQIFPKPKFFHLDAGIIELISTIQEFRNYNTDSYDRLVRTLDTFLKIKFDIESGVNYCKENLQIAKRFKTQCLNYLHSIIFMVPSDINVEGKLKKALNSLHFILNHHIDVMTDECKKLKQDNVVDYYKDYDQPGENDPLRTKFGASNFNFYF